MGAKLKRMRAMAVMCGTVASVWSLGALKADLDEPTNAGLRVDPAIVQRAFLAAEEASAAQAAALAGPVDPRLSKAAG